MIPISSNDYDFYLDNQTVYVICQTASRLEFQPVRYFRNDNCELPLIPDTEVDFTKMLHSLENYTFNSYSDSVKSIRFWTDYKRTNETHFWSDVASNWWSLCRSSELLDQQYAHFFGSVKIDGYKKLKNAQSDNLSCICVVKVISKTAFG